MFQPLFFRGLQRKITYGANIYYIMNHLTQVVIDKKKIVITLLFFFQSSEEDLIKEVELLLSLKNHQLT